MQFVLLYLLYIFLLLLFCEEAQANAGFNDNTSRNEVSLRIRRALRQNGDIYMSRSFAGCPYGWTAGDGGCYYMPLQKVTSRDTAMQKCLKLGAHLVTVESEKENAFLSLKFKYIRDPILTGGIKTSQWAWEKISDRQQNSRINYGHIIQVPITHFFNWFPGWRGEIKYDDPSDGIDENCIYLRSRYIHPVYENEANLDIFYWSDDVCLSTKTRLEGGFRYLCEKPKKISKDVVRCADSQFTCGSGLCLLASSVCDGVCHCYPDCEDERKYGPLRCNYATISLVNGTESEGRLEVTINGQRGVVCDDSFDDNAAKIYCNVLDFKYGQAITGSAFGEGSAPIVLDDIKCTGTESSTWKCRKSEFGTHDCDRSEIVGIKCSNVMLKETSAQPQCGKRPRTEYFKEDIAPYIIGGIRPPRHGLFPWQAGIRKRHKHFCGGTIINRHWILTAAHCFYEERRTWYYSYLRQYERVDNDDFVIRTGDYDNTKRDKYEQEFNIAHVEIHEFYDPEETGDYDIALVKIKTDGNEGIDFNDHVQPACLPTTSTEYKQGHKCYVSGWGASRYSNVLKKVTQYPTTLQGAEIPLQSDETCSSIYENRFTTRMVCAGNLEGGVNACYGDSGGPLVCMENSAYVVMGITSFGSTEGCALPDLPTVFTKVSRFVHWIETHW
ncbi:neurotrypsin-like [Mercenaria mercenaria]|uniref:neurotrypsin-like n=1 Tax=Mercenaria mercenaria TaxID=6596 RepID=UPI00234EF316|nr:neurotrypsin-like [Mercenaria mercenaria]